MINLVLKKVIKSRGGNESDADRIVHFSHPFSYFQNIYEYKYRCYSNRDADRMFSQIQNENKYNDIMLVSYNESTIEHCRDKY